MEKILIVDDNIPQGNQLKAILNDEYEVTIAQTAEEGVSHASTGFYSLVLLNIALPGMDAFVLLKTLQGEVITQNIPVILITGIFDVEREQRGIELGAVDYITKPFKPFIIKARVHTHIKLYNFGKQSDNQIRPDQLGEISNRREHDDCRIAKWNEAIRMQLPFSICIFDIDCFKAYNDIFGHPAGDKVIAAIAKTISSHLRCSGDFFAQYGGEQFVAWFIGVHSGKALEDLKKIRQAVEDLHIPHDSAIAEWVTISIGGVTAIPGEESSYDFYLKIADIMLYDAKKFGRNRIVWADENMKQLEVK